MRFRDPRIRAEEMKREIKRAEDQEKVCGNWPPVGDRRGYLVACYDALETIERQVKDLAFLEID